MKELLRHLTNAPVAVALAFLLVGAPTAPAAKLLPSSGKATANWFPFDVPYGRPDEWECNGHDGSCRHKWTGEIWLNGVLYDPEGRPVDGRTHDDFADEDGQFVDGGDSAIDRLVDSVLNDVTAVPRENAERVAKEVCRLTGANQVSFQVQGGAGVASGSVTVTYDCKRWF